MSFAYYGCSREILRLGCSWGRFVCLLFLSGVCAFSREGFAGVFSAGTAVAALPSSGEVRSAGEKSGGGRLEQDMKKIKRRLRARVEGRAPARSSVLAVLGAQRGDGSWPDIDYANRNRANWQPAGHMGKLLILARALVSTEAFGAEHGALAAAVGRGLDFWFEKDFICPNWWYNDIGVPRQLYRVMLLAEGTLTPAQMHAGLKILERAKLGMTGQNLVWVAEVTIARGCLAGDAAVVAEAFDRVEREIRVSTGEGIQRDWSFHQHGDQLYSGGYGRGFSADVPYFAALAAGTSFAFSPQKVSLLSHYILDGQQWMIRRRRFDYSACGREICRRGAANARSLAGAWRTMISVDPERADEFRRFALRLEKGADGGSPPLSGHRHFWRSDFTVHHRPLWYASVRLTSPRLLQTETCNEENLFGALLSDGVNYLFMDGNEYDGIFPVWDWRRLPGITVEMRAEAPRTRNGARGADAFAGGVSDGRYGCSAMIFRRKTLRARKAWFFLDQGYLCLGTGIECAGDNDVITSVTQCLRRGTIRFGSGKTAAAGETVHQTLSPGEWVHHNQVAYLFLRGKGATVNAEPQTGSWYAINHMYAKKEVRRDVFSMWIEHGRQPQGEEYAYVVLPAVDPDEVDAARQAFGIEILANREDCQAIRQPRTGIVQAVFYQASANGAADALPPELPRVDRPCLVQLVPQGGGLILSVCNPAGKNGPLTIEVPGRYRGDGRIETKKDTSVVRVILPKGDLAGSCVCVDLRACE